MSKTHGGKGDRPRPIDRKGWEESKLWENIEKKKQDEWWQNDTSEIGEINIKAGDPLAAGQILIPTRKGKKKELKRANKQIEEAEQLKIELNSDHNIKVCNHCGEYKILDDFEDTKSKYYLRLPYHKGKRIRCRECEKELVR